VVLKLTLSQEFGVAVTHPLRPIRSPYFINPTHPFPRYPIFRRKPNQMLRVEVWAKNLSDNRLERVARLLHLRRFGENSLGPAALKTAPQQKHRIVAVVLAAALETTNGREFDEP
jgi:hypothetical protein